MRDIAFDVQRPATRHIEITPLRELQRNGPPGGSALDRVSLRIERGNQRRERPTTVQRERHIRRRIVVLQRDASRTVERQILDVRRSDGG